MQQRTDRAMTAAMMMRIRTTWEGKAIALAHTDRQTQLESEREREREKNVGEEEFCIL